MAPAKSGVLILLAAGLLLSTGGLVVRQIETATSAQVLFYRAVGMALGLGMAMLARRHRVGRDAAATARFLIDGKTALVGAAFALSLGTYLFALMHTTIASAMFIFSTSPLVAALLAWLWLGELVDRLTWAVIGASLIGLTIMFYDGIALGSIFGQAAAFGNALAYGATIVLLRRHRDIDMAPALMVAAALTGLAGAALSGGIVVPLSDGLWAVLLGAVHTGGAFFLITLGARHLPAAVVALLLLSEPILSPIWAWLVIGETPSQLALLGGVILLGAVATQAVAGSLSARERPANA